MTDELTRSDETREKVLKATAALIETGGPDAATTRAVATAAGVQPPVIYRLFGDKRGLLDAVLEKGMATYVAEKARKAVHPDPVEDLRAGWDMYVAFGLENPGLFAVMSSAPGPRSPASATSAGLEVLEDKIRRLAKAGRLRVSEARASSLMQAAGSGTVLTLLGQPAETRDTGLSETAREAVLTAITGETSLADTSGLTGAAAALRASLDEAEVLSPGERLLLGELLDRIIKG